MKIINKVGPPRPGLVPQTGDPRHPGRWVLPESSDVPLSSHPGFNTREGLERLKDDALEEYSTAYAEFHTAGPGTRAERLSRRQRFEASRRNLQEAKMALYHFKGPLTKQGPPGPPPRPGLVWKPLTHRWIRPDTGHEWTASGISIPPAWKDVVTFPVEAKVHAIGTDAAGRRQYLYRPGVAEEGKAEKLSRMKRFTKAVPSMRRQARADLPKSEEAQVTYLIDKTWFRVGSTVDTRAKVQAYGSTTLLSKHVKVKGSKVSFDFIAKHGIHVVVTINDKVLAGVLAARKAGKGPDDRLFATTGAKVRSYIRKIGNAPDFKVHDWRAHHATKYAKDLINNMPEPATPKDYKAAVKNVSTEVSKRLWNTPKQALTAYIAPEVWAKWEAALQTGGKRMKKAAEQDDFDPYRDVHYAEEFDEVAKALTMGSLGMKLWGDLFISKAEEDAELGEAGGANIVGLPGVPPQNLGPNKNESKGKAMEALAQVSRLLQQLLQDPELSEQLQPDERERLRLIGEWLKEGGKPMRRPEEAHDMGYETQLHRAVMTVAKALDTTISVKAIIKGPKGTLILKDAYSDFWDLPGGHVQDGETMSEALRREVKEETALEITGLRERGVRMLKLDSVRPVVFYDAVTDGGPPLLSEEHLGYQWAQERDVDSVNLGVFREFVFKELLFPGGQDVSVQRPSNEPESKAVEGHYTDGTTNPHYQAMAKRLAQMAQEPINQPIAGAPSIGGMPADSAGMASELDNPTPTVTKEGEGISGAGDTMTSDAVHTPVGGSSRREDRMRVIVRKAKGITLAKAMGEKTFLLSRGDAAEKMGEFEPNSVHLCVTSPPYWDPTGPRGGLSKELTPGDFAYNLTKIFRTLHKAMISHGSLWLILGDGRAKVEDRVPEQVLKAMVADGWLHQKTYAWNKGTGNPDRVFHLTKQQTFYRAPMFALPTTLIESPSELLDGAGFMAFPVELASKVIKATCREGDVVVDPFVGTGAAIEAAVLSGRRGIGIDISQNELNVAGRRMAMVSLAGNSMKLKKAVDSPEQYDLKVLKGFTGPPGDNRFIVAGYASPVIVDLEGHKITHEALARDLPRFMAEGGQYANVNILHSNITVGKILPEFTDNKNQTYRTTVDDRGLFVVAEVRTDDAAPAVCKQVIDDIINGKLRSFSISGNADNPTFTCDGERCFYSINDLQLAEITLCEEGVNPDAKFDVINKSLDGKRNRLTYNGIPLVKRSTHDDLFEAASLEKYQDESDIGQGNPNQAEEKGDDPNPTKTPFSIVNSEADLMSYFAEFTHLFKAHYVLGNLEITLYDPDTGEVLLPEEDF